MMRRVVFVLLLLAAPVFAQIDPRAQLLLSLSLSETIIRPVDAIAKSVAWSETNTYSDEKLSLRKPRGCKAWRDPFYTGRST